jgi:hypothetical protein
MRRWILLASTLVLIAIIMTGVFFAFAMSQSPRQKYDLNVEVNQAYFKVWNTSADSGISYKQLIACVLFVNVTNTSDKEMAITRATIEEQNDLIGFRSDFIDSEDYIFAPHTSK